MPVAERYGRHKKHYYFCNTFYYFRFTIPRTKQLCEDLVLQEMFEVISLTFSLDLTEFMVWHRWLASISDQAWLSSQQRWSKSVILLFISFFSIHPQTGKVMAFKFGLVGPLNLVEVSGKTKYVIVVLALRAGVQPYWRIILGFICFHGTCTFFRTPSWQTLASILTFLSIKNGEVVAFADVSLKTVTLLANSGFLTTSSRLSLH